MTTSVAPRADTSQRADELVEQHYAAVLNLAYRTLGRRDDAEDVAQQTFARALTRLDDLRDPAAARAWLFRIAVNCCLDELRQRQRHQIVTKDEARWASVPDTKRASIPAQAAELSELRVNVWRATLRLPAQQRVALALRELHGMSYADIAAALQTSVAAVETLLFRARQGFRQAYQPEQRALADNTCTNILVRLSASIDGELQPSDQARVDKHIANCAKCSFAARELRAMSRLYGLVPMLLPSGGEISAALLGSGGIIAAASAAGGATAASGVVGGAAVSGAGAVAGSSISGAVAAGASGLAASVVAGTEVGGPVASGALVSGAAASGAAGSGALGGGLSLVSTTIAAAVAAPAKVAAIPLAAAALVLASAASPAPPASIDSPNPTAIVATPSTRVVGTTSPTAVPTVARVHTDLNSPLSAPKSSQPAPGIDPSRTLPSTTESAVAVEPISVARTAKQTPTVSPTASPTEESEPAMPARGRAEVSPPAAPASNRRRSTAAATPAERPPAKNEALAAKGATEREPPSKQGESDARAHAAISDDAEPGPPEHVKRAAADGAGRSPGSPPNAGAHDKELSKAGHTGYSGPVEAAAPSAEPSNAAKEQEHAAAKSNNGNGNGQQSAGAGQSNNGNGNGQQSAGAGQSNNGNGNGQQSASAGQSNNGNGNGQQSAAAPESRLGPEQKPSDAPRSKSPTPTSTNASPSQGPSQPSQGTVADTTVPRGSTPNAPSNPEPAAGGPPPKPAE